MAWATTFLATVEYTEGNLARSQELAEQSLSTFREIDSSFGIGNSLAILGNVARSAGDPAGAMRHHREALELFRVVGDREGQAAILAALAIDERDAGRPEAAAGHFGEAIDIVATLGNRSWLAELSYLAGDSWLAASDLMSADERFRESLEIARNLDTDQARSVSKMSLEGCAWWSYRAGHVERAVTLFAVLDGMDHIETQTFFQAEPASRDDALTQARARLGSQLYQSLWSGGRSMSIADATSYALAEPDDTARVASLGPASSKRPNSSIRCRFSSGVSRRGLPQNLSTAAWISLSSWFKSKASSWYWSSTGSNFPASTASSSRRDQSRRL